MRRYDHIDLRVKNLDDVRSFYLKLLPALGFDRDAKVPGWFQFENSTEQGITEFFGIVESPDHVPNENRIAFRASSNEEVEKFAKLVTEAGARNIEGPLYEEPGYYAIFFEDPAGNRLEVCHRK